MSDIFSGLANLTKTVTDSLNTYEIRKLGDKVQGYVMNFTEPEQKVREATNEDPWGPTGPQMQEIAHMTFQYDAFPEIMGMLWKRMFQENKAAWRRVYKSLILLNYLLKNGSERVVQNARDHLFEMRALESYKYTDEKGKDQGINVRHRAKLVIELIQDEELLRDERRKAKTEGKEKYQGYSKEEMRGGFSSSNFDSNKWKKSSYDDDFSSRDRDRDRDRDFSSPQREVTAFDFAESRHQTASPELGIRERTPEPQDDDEFGDFAEARNTDPTWSTSAQKATFASNGTSVSHVSPPPAIPGPGLGGVKTVTTPAPVQHNTANLLDLDFGPPATATQTQAQPGLFGNVSPSMGSNQGAVRPPRPPSGGPAGGPPASNNTLDDLFGPPVTGQPLSQAPATSNSNNLDIFGDFSAPAPAAPTQLNLFGGFPTTSAPAPASVQSNNVDLFGDFTSTPAPAAPSMSSSNSIDLFSSAPASRVPSSISTPNFLDFGSPLAPSPAQTLTPMSGSQSASGPSTGLGQNANKPEVKLPDRWADVTGKVNIDLDNLSLRSPKKQSVPMNQMKAQNQNNSGLNW